MKILGVAMSASLLFSLNVHAEEVEDLVDSEDITSISDGIDTLDDKVDNLNDNCSDDELSQDISDISAEIDALNEMVANLNKKYTNLLLTINKNKLSIIKGLNKSVYANDNISESATYSDIISKINDIKYHGTLNVTLDGNEKYTLERGYYDGGTIDVSAMIEAARQEGIKEGKEKGIEEGKKQAIAENKQQWINEGKQQGYAQGVKDKGAEYLGTGNTFYLAGNHSDYRSLNANNFVCEVDSDSVSNSKRCTVTYSSWDTDYTYAGVTISKSYDANSGVLSVSAYISATGGRSGDGYVNATKPLRVRAYLVH